MRERDFFKGGWERAQSEIEKLRAHNEEKDALIQELKDRYMKDAGKPFKPSPKRRGV